VQSGCGGNIDARMMVENHMEKYRVAWGIILIFTRWENDVHFTEIFCVSPKCCGQTLIEDLGRWELLVMELDGYRVQGEDLVTLGS